MFFFDVPKDHENVGKNASSSSNSSNVGGYATHMCGTEPCARALFAHLDGFAGQLEKASRDGHHPGVLRVKRSQKCHRVAAEVLLVVDEALGEEGHVALVEVVDDSALAAVLLHERYPQLVALDCVQHLNTRASGYDGRGGVVVGVTDD